MTDQEWQFWATIANAASAVGMLLFAAVQVGLTAWSERTRRVERQADREERLAHAHGVLWAESLRIWATTEAWKRHDFLAAAIARQIHPDDILPRDWPSLLESGTTLGRETAGLLSGALAAAHELQRELEGFVELVNKRNTSPGDYVGPRGLDNFKKIHPDLVPIADALQKKLQELNTLLDDARLHSPLADRAHTYNFKDTVASEHARLLLKELKKQP